MFGRISGKEAEALVAAANSVIQNAFILWSSTKVGAAVLTAKGNIYEGCNVEMFISGMGACAERNAIAHMVAHGEYSIKAIAVTSTSEEITEPCGMCCEMIYEFSQIVQKDIEIIMTGNTGKIKRTTIRKLLPLRTSSQSDIAKLRQYNK